MKIFEVIVILGNRDPVIYNARASNAVRIFLKKINLNENVYLLPKFYEKSWTLQTFELSLHKYKKNILLDSISDYYRNNISTHDTINEALGTRFILEDKYVNLDTPFVVHLTIVTSQCHENRSKWIFESIFKDLQWVKLYFNSSITTFIERNLNRDDVEKAVLQNQYKIITNEGGFYNFINNRNLNKTYTYYYFKKDNDKYKLIYNPF